jgi:hypothetical protein
LKGHYVRLASVLCNGRERAVEPEPCAGCASYRNGT